MGPYRDAPLDLSNPRIRKVSKRVYLWNGQFMYNTAAAGVRLFDIPDEDVFALETRTGRVELLAACAALAVLIGVLSGVMSMWCLPVVLVLIVFATPVLVGRSVSERYRPASDPAAARAVRGRIVIDQPPTAAALAALVLNLPSSFTWFSTNGRGSKAALAASLLLIDVVRLLAGLIERKAAAEESTAS